MNIELTDQVATAIREQGEHTFPYECCGFMLGKEDENGRRFTELISAENTRAENKERRFEITPKAFMDAERYAEKNGLELLGFYHSHPNHPAKPSDYDLAHAWPRYSYVIVSVMEGKSADMTSWILKEDRSAFDEQNIMPH